MPADPEAPALDLPEEWSDDARGTFESVLEQRADLAGAEYASLWQACALESAADRLDGVAQAAGMVATGSTGQVVIHPAVTEARLARTAAAAILARLTPARAGALTNSQRGTAAARARWSQ